MNTENGLRVVDADPGGDGARLSVASAGICGTDVSFAAAGVSGFIYGHEFAGVDGNGTSYFVDPAIYRGMRGMPRREHPAVHRARPRPPQSLP
jgi:threonine dehydrogenase-like Zn-dependent dehydrogenase